MLSRLINWLFIKDVDALGTNESYAPARLELIGSLYSIGNIESFDEDDRGLVFDNSNVALDCLPDYGDDFLKLVGKVVYSRAEAWALQGVMRTYKILCDANPMAYDDDCVLAPEFKPFSLACGQAYEVLVREGRKRGEDYVPPA